MAVAEGSRRVVIAGVSARAAAESAARAGFAVTAIDAFGDLDQYASVRAVSLARDVGTRFSATAAVRVARTVECDAVAYLSNFENHPKAVGDLAQGRALWGNTPAVLRRVRNPVLLSETLRRRGIPTPDVMLRRREDGVAQALRPALRARVGSPERAALRQRAHRWLLKPRASGGGRGVRVWSNAGRAVDADALDLPRGWYLQELIEGTAGSVVFVAAGGRAVLLGVSRQLVGDSRFGAMEYQYCGSMFAAADDAHFAEDAALMAAARTLALIVTEEFELVGLNGIDFIARDGVPYAIEVNPRWCASMELVERAHGVSVFGAHAAACVGGALPSFDLEEARQRVAAIGKAVVFAREDVTAGDTRAWLEDESVRDIPQPGERILTGQPICTVFAEGRDAESCHEALVARADRVYAEIPGSGGISITATSRHHRGGSH